MKLHLPKRLLTALLAAFTAFSLSTGSTAWGEESSEVTEITSPINYAVYEDTAYAYDVVQWTGGKGVCYGNWYVASYDANGKCVSLTESESRNEWKEVITSADRVTLLLDGTSGKNTSSTDAYYDINAAKFSGIIVTADSKITKLRSNAGKRSITLGTANDSASKGYTSIEHDFTLTNEEANDTGENGVAFSLTGLQEWRVAKDATFTLKTNTKAEKITHNGNLTITGSGATKFESLLHHQSGSITIDEQTSLNLSSGYIQNAGASLILNGSLTASKLFSSNGGTSNITGTGTLTLSGAISVEGSLSFTTGVTELVDFSMAGAGTLNLGTVNLSAGTFFMMNYDGGAINATSLGTVGEGSEFAYGKGSKLANLGALNQNLTLNIYDVADQLSSGVNLGFSLGDKTLEEAKALLSINGLQGDYTLEERDGSLYLTSTGTLTTGWDINWGGRGLAGQQTTSTTITNIPESCHLQFSEDTTSGPHYYHIENDFVAGETVSVILNDAGNYSASAVIVGGFATSKDDNAQGTVQRNVWIRANAGSYYGIVGGNLSNNWSNNHPAAHFIGNTHILIDGATVGAIIGGNLRDAKAAQFTGNSYISVFSGDVTGYIVGAGSNAHNNTTTFNGDTNIFVYVPLATNTGNFFKEDERVIAGGGIKQANSSGVITLNGNTHVTIDLSAYTGSVTSFSKTITGGHYSNLSGHTQNINGDTHVNIIGKEGVTFSNPVVGGSYNNNGAIAHTGSSYLNISGSSTFNNAIVGGNYKTSTGNSSITTTSLTISGGTFSNDIAGGNYSTAASANNTTSSSVVINDGNFSVANGQKKVITGGDFTTAASTNTINTSSVTINKGTFSNYSIVGGTYTTASSTNTVGSSSVTINGGTFSTDSTGGTGDPPYNHLIVGGSMLNGDVANTSFTTTNTSVTITGGDIGMDIYGGHVDLISPSGSNAFTATLDNAIVTLNGANAKVDNIYGGSFAYRDNNNAVMTQGDVVVDLIAGTVRGKVYAAGRQVHDTDIVTESTEVRISDGVQFTSASAIVSGGYQIGCTEHPRTNPSSVTGNKTLVFNGASQDRSAITFDSFDTIQVTNKDAVVTLDKLTNFTNLTKTGAGTLTLGSNSAYTGITMVQGGELVLSSSPGSGSISISQGAKLTLQSTDFSLAQTVSGEGELVVKNGVTLTFESSSKLGTHLRIEDGGRVEFSGTGSDQFNYGDTFFRTVYLKGTAELALGTTRQTVGNWTFDMTGGVISGQGQTDHPYALDFHRSATILARADEGATAENPTVSMVSATIRTKERGEFKLDVENNARLDLTGAVNLGLKTIKDGAGLAVISGPIESLGVVEVQEGTLELQSSASSTSNLTVNTGAEFEISAGVSTLSGTVTNSGAITVSGGSATLSGAVTNNGTITVSSGTAEFSNSLGMGAGSSLSVSGGSATLSGAVTNNGTITVSGGTAEFTNTLGMGTDSSLSVSGGSATVSSALNVTGSGVQIGQSGDGILNLTGQMSVAENASATMSGAITLGHTITNDGNLTLNGTIYLTGDINTSFTTRGLGGSSFVLYDGTASENGNGFNKVSGASYWLTQSTEGLTGATNTLGGNFAQVDSKHVVYHGDKSYEVITENGQIYFSSGDMTGTQYYITAGDVVVNSEVQSAATGYTLQGGNMQLTEGSVNTSDITYTSGFIELSAGAELVVDGMPAGMTANSLLSSILTSSSGGNVKITQNGLDTWDGEGTEPSDYDLNSAFAGTLELAADVDFTLGKGGDGQYSDAATITLALTGLKLNNGSTLYYNASGATTIQNLQVAGAAATIHFKDSKSTNAVQFTGKTQLDGALTVSTTYDGGITFANLVGGGSLSSSSGQGDFKTTISSLQYEGSTFSGNLSFTGGNNIVQVSTGTESDLSFASLNASGVKSFTFNAQANTTIGTLNAAGGIVNVSEGKTLSLRGGTETEQKEHSVGSITTATGAGISLGDYATLTLNAIPARPSNGANSDTVASMAINITGGEKSRLNLNLISQTDWQYNNTVSLSALTEGGKTVDDVYVQSGYLAADVFSGSAKTDMGGATLHLGAKNGISGLLIRGTQNQTINLNTAGIKVHDTATLFLYGNMSAASHTLEDSISGDKLEIINGDGGDSNGGIKLSGSVDLKELSNKAKADVELSGESIKLGSLNVNTSTQAMTTISGNATADSVSVQQGKLSVTADGELNLGDAATITKAEGGNAASMENVKLSEEGIASADETKATKGSVADAKVTLAALAARTSFSIEDVTLSNVNIEAANAETKVNLSGVSAKDVQLTKGEFHMLDKPQVGTGGSAINPVEGVHTDLQFSTSLLNGMTLGADASMVVDLGDMSGFTGMSSGKPTFSITLEGFRISDYLAENAGIYFAADSWLGQLLVAQGASQYVKGDTLEAGTQATAGTGSGVSVRYYNSTSSVGTVIIISGLQVPEPTTTSLSLLALSALAMRRRRK